MIPLPALVSLVARNLVPAAGVLFFGWSAGNLLALYFLDTVLALAAVVLLVARHVTGLGKAGEPTRPLRGPIDWLRATFGAVFAAALISVPLGVPVYILLVQFGWSATAAIGDRSFLIGIAIQVGGSIAGCIDAHRDLLARSDDERVLKRRTAFIFARWLVVVMVAFVPFWGFLGPWIGGTLVVLVYAAATIYFELMPDRALLWLNPKEAGAPAPMPKRRR